MAAKIIELRQCPELPEFKKYLNKELGDNTSWAVLVWDNKDEGIGVAWTDITKTQVMGALEHLKYQMLIADDE